MTCKARQFSDQMRCDACALTWDVNDPDPPECKRVPFEMAPPHTRMTPEQALSYVLKENELDPLQDVIVACIDATGSLVVRSSSMSRATAAFILQRALYHAHNILDDGGCDVFSTDQTKEPVRHPRPAPVGEEWGPDEDPAA